MQVQTGGRRITRPALSASGGRLGRPAGMARQRFTLAWREGQRPLGTFDTAASRCSASPDPAR